MRGMENMGERLSRRLGDAWLRLVWHELGQRLEVPVFDRLVHELSDPMWSQLRRQLENELWNRLRKEMDSIKQEQL